MGVRIEGIDGAMRFLKKGARNIMDSFLKDLEALGYRAVADIRDKSPEEGFRDSTGNLRSSIGFVIVKDGRIVSRGGFDRVDGPNRAEAAADGSVRGLAYAEQLAARYPKGLALIVVAGMDYAAYLQDVEGKDVLASGEIFLNKEVKRLIAEYNRKYGK